MSKTSTRLYTTVSPELGEAVERKAKERLISVPDLLRQIISDYVSDDPPVVLVDPRQIKLPEVAR